MREYLQNNTKVQDFQFTHKDIQSAISKLKNNKSAGLNNLHGEHYKHAGARLSILHCKLFNSMLNHGYIPEDLIYNCLRSIHASWLCFANEDQVEEVHRGLVLQPAQRRF